MELKTAVISYANGSVMKLTCLTTAHCVPLLAVITTFNLCSLNAEGRSVWDVDELLELLYLVNSDFGKTTCILPSLWSSQCTDLRVPR